MNVAVWQIEVDRWMQLVKGCGLLLSLFRLPSLYNALEY
jgi:hypothetical protein